MLTGESLSKGWDKYIYIHSGAAAQGIIFLWKMTFSNASNVSEGQFTKELWKDVRHYKEEIIPLIYEQQV